jgi:hypothetical protein
MEEVAVSPEALTGESEFWRMAIPYSSCIRDKAV